MKQDLIELGNRVVSSAEKFGATQAEAYIESKREIAVRVKKGLIRMASEKFDTGCGIRVACDNQMGVSYVTSILEKDLDQAVKDAIAAARASVADRDFKSFVSVQSSYPRVQGIFDKQLAEIDCEQAVDIVSRAIQASKEVSEKEQNLIEGGFKAESMTTVIVNSHGISGSYSGTTTELDISSTIGVGDDKCSSWHDETSRKLSDIDPEKIGQKSAQNALDIRGAKTIDGGDLPLILTPRALWAVLGTGFGRALDARQVQEGKSYLVDSLGSQIASSELDITDNGILEGALGSRPFDVEGFPSQSTPLISSGILQSYLHDSYTFAKDDVDGTGNAIRESYRATPSIGVTNLVVSPGRSSLENMISEMKKGVLCTFTFDRPNFVTGELSAMIMEGFLVSNGEVQHALKNTLFGITMQDLMNRVTYVGSDVESREHVITPTILVDSVKITSGK
ncbi:MAG: TldD/PmbA family protein [Candidatus Thorarchaeota archaeon]